MTATIPETHRDLLERPIVAHLGTIRESGHVHVNPMWYVYDGEKIRFTHTTGRKKFQNLQRDPAMTLEILDPENTGRYLELRGRLESIEKDEGAEFYKELQRRYGVQYEVPDADERIVLTMVVEQVAKQ